MSTIVLNLGQSRPNTALRMKTPLNPIAAEVVSHRLWSINEEGSTTIIHASGSPVVHATDYNFGIYMPNGDIAISGTFYMIPLFTMTTMIQLINEKFAGDIAEGDVFMTNDPFIASVHQNDVQFVAPFFYDGDLIAWTGCMAHMLDVGGKYPGSWVPDALSCFEEGIRVPLAKIVDGGKLNRALWDTILHASRLPLFVGNDFSAFLSAHRVTHERLNELCRKYGADVVHDTMAQTISDTEEEMRAIITSLPDGEYSHVGYYDHNGFANDIYRVSTVLTKKDDRLSFDLTDAAGQIVGMGNASKWGTMGAIATAVMGSFGQKLHWNAGIMAPVDIKLTTESILSAELPSPVSAGSTAANWVAAVGASACVSKMMAFTPALHDLVCGPPDGSWLLATFGGQNRSGDPFAIMFMDSLGWGGPAFGDRDGVDSGGSLVCLAGGFNDVELHEKTTPLLYLWRREMPDSGGAGKFRGGNGIEYALAVHGSELVAATLASHGAALPDLPGMLGAYPGSTCRYEVARGSDWLAHLQDGERLTSVSLLGGEHSTLPTKSATELKNGDVVNCVLQNAGGYGDPIERAPDLVWQDVRSGAVTAHFANVIYGLPAGTGDEQPSDEVVAARREAIRRERLAGSTRGPAVRAEKVSIDQEQIVASWGKKICFVKNEGSLHVGCTSCGTIMGSAEGVWRDATASRKPEADELGPSRALDERFFYDQSLCPHCATSLWIDIRHVSDPAADDFRALSFLSAA